MGRIIDSRLSRRRFIGGLAASGVLWAAQPLTQLSRAARKSRGHALRLVFFTDVHARTEWETPIAMAKAAAAINALRPDLVIGGGDYITDGFQSPPPTADLKI